MSEEMSDAVMRRAASSTDTKKQRKTKEKADELGVCLIGKRESPSKVVPVCSGCLLKSLFPRSRENLYIIASGDTFPSEARSSKWQNYILYFQRWDSDTSYDDKLKEYALPDVRKSEEDIEFIEGILIIPIDPEKLGKGSVLSFIRRCGRSGMLTYRPYQVKSEEYTPGSLAGSFCQIVDGGTCGFAVKTFVLEYTSGKYVLKLPEKGHVFKTWTEVTGGGSNSLHPRGAVILRRQDQEDQRSLAVAVLKFVNDDISPVLLSQISGSSGKTNNQKKAEKSAVETEHKEEEDKPPTENKALSGNGERRSSKDAVAVQTPAHDEASAVQGKALPIVTGRENFAPKRNNAAENLDGMTSNEASGHKSSVDRSLDEVVIEPESNNKTPVSASAGQGNDKVLLSNRNRSLDQASQHGAALTESAETATAPEYAVQENNCATAPKFENHIKDVHGNLLIGDHINATIGSNSSINASQHQAAFTESTNTAATPEHAVQEDNHATVSKFENHIKDVHGNLLIGDHINATIGANSSSINEPQRRPAQNAETPGAATPGPIVAPQCQSVPAMTPEGAAREPSVRHANSGPRPKYVNRIQGVGPNCNVIIGDHASVNIESSSGRRTTGSSNTRGSSGP